MLTLACICSWTICLICSIFHAGLAIIDV
uniref:Uncharacterized protein n=1 Tax=Arundo donax TaxID=35708 RepID=A0A0A8ZJF2_ARUDO